MRRAGWSLPGLGSARLTETTPAQLAAYRSRHRIAVVRDFDEDTGRFVELCATDHIRIYRRASGWLHDRGEIRDFAALERGETIKW